MNQRIVKILNRLCAIVLIVSIWTTAIGSMFEYAMAPLPFEPYPASWLNAEL